MSQYYTTYVYIRHDFPKIYYAICLLLKYFQVPIYIVINIVMILVFR